MCLVLVITHFLSQLLNFFFALAIKEATVCTFCKTLLNSQLTGTSAAWSASAACEEKGEEPLRVVQVGNGTKLAKGYFRLEIRKKLTMKPIRLWNRLPEGTAGSPTT